MNEGEGGKVFLRMEEDRTSSLLSPGMIRAYVFPGNRDNDRNRVVTGQPLRLTETELWITG